MLSILAVVRTTVAIGALKQRKVYQAKAILQIDSENPNIMSFKDFMGVEGADEDTYRETVYKNLQSWSLALEVIQKLHMDRLEEFNQMSSGPSFSLFGPSKATPNAAGAVR